MKPLISILQIVLLVICLKDLVNAVEGESKTRDDVSTIPRGPNLLLYYSKDIMQNFKIEVLVTILIFINLPMS